MRIRYVGTDDHTDNAVCVAFGVTFERGEWVDLDEVPAKLKDNPTFEVGGPGGRRKKADTTEGEGA